MGSLTRIRREKRFIERIIRKCASDDFRAFCSFEAIDTRYTLLVIFPVPNTITKLLKTDSTKSPYKNKHFLKKKFLNNSSLDLMY